MGHANLKTTERYLGARRAAQMLDDVNRAHERVPAGSCSDSETNCGLSMSARAHDFSANSLRRDDRSLPEG
jgi:hypothetical protein